ncbi:isoprenoid biosynthesis glyoxalase ElbB [Magnetofaba australis]|uniref:Putative isoprenoid biosynthesis protein n=1 Tax=Magnetofaba australis IT-1 TaxID=1434232 RepID=A0A1Y2JYT2_9PROT|nr:isoprenoid biosynthesis glyoxalase ElbB [Magnetofaba australis]OSM00050.1 putative isoprenoid biosynthesis protein [Magnetofaba australis IT-1]
MGKKIGVVLSGCGVFDGAEIHEATLTLFFLDRVGAEAICYAPDIAQHHVINHLTGSEMDETRNVMVESARIARGKITPLSEARAEDMDALILPGGFGAAKNLSSVAFDGAEATVNSDLALLLGEIKAAGKPIGAMCISPAVVSKALAEQGVTVTIGDDAGTAGAIEAMGNTHQTSAVEQIVVDDANNIVTTAAYMCAASIAQVGEGIEKLVAEVLKRA